jgi:hypothetical protein
VASQSFGHKTGGRKGDQFHPKVFAEGSYTVIVGNQKNKVKKLKELKSITEEDTKIIQLAF